MTTPDRQIKPMGHHSQHAPEQIPNQPVASQGYVSHFKHPQKHEFPKPEEKPAYELVTASDFEKNQVCLYLKSAIQFKLTRFENSAFPTIAIQTSNIINSKGVRQGNWKQKDKNIFFKMKLESEVTQLAAFLLKNTNKGDTIEFAFHGDDKKKSLKVIRNEDMSVCFILADGKKTYNPVIKPVDLFHVTFLLLRALAYRHSTDPNSMANMLRALPGII